jgi:hypothetical protein
LSTRRALAGRRMPEVSTVNARTLSRWKLALFVGLSVADFLLTWWLISSTGGIVYESNPVAGWLLSRYGWPGLAAFKGLAATTVIGSAVTLCLCRRPSGERVLTFACSATGGVVLYSGLLAAALLELHTYERVMASLLPLFARANAAALLR